MHGQPYIKMLFYVCKGFTIVLQYHGSLFIDVTLKAKQNCRMEATFLISILQLPQDPMLVDVGAPFNAIKFILKFAKYGRRVQTMKGQY